MNKKTIKAACIQMCSSTDLEINIKSAVSLITEAAKQGAELIITPEMTTLLERNSERLFKKVKTEDEDISLAIFSKLAVELHVDLVIGSIPIKISDQKCANRSYFITHNGKIAAHYDKIHMFDVQLAAGEVYKESKNFQTGDKAVIIETEAYNLGLSICYDLRFPELFRDLALNGAEIISVPAAFTVPTGKAHWHTLLRARAIETGCFILAAAQSGNHEDGRETYGHSLIVNPWGEVIAEKESGTGFIMAELDLALVEDARNKIPSLKHRKDYFISNTHIKYFSKKESSYTEKPNV
jgi:deaminated glutathione amidase